jgi:hypothetical protein
VKAQEDGKAYLLKFTKYNPRYCRFQLVTCIFCWTLLYHLLLQCIFSFEANYVKRWHLLLNCAKSSESCRLRDTCYSSLPPLLLREANGYATLEIGCDARSCVAWETYCTGAFCLWNGTKIRVKLPLYLSLLNVFWCRYVVVSFSCLWH